MIEKQTKKRLKAIRKEIKSLKKLHVKLEFRPCNNDAELREKERELKALRQRINELEKEQDRCMLNSGAFRHGG